MRENYDSCHNSFNMCVPYGVNGYDDATGQYELH